jgi:hypothetical protein
MQEQVQELSNLPLSFLISAPLNAAVEAQRAAALSTAAFIEEVGFQAPPDKRSLFTRSDSTREVRQAVLKYKQDEVREKTPADPTTTPPTKAVYEVVKGVERTLQLPFISLFNVPSLEISEVAIDFNVRLQGATQFEVSASQKSSTSTTVTGSVGAQVPLAKIPIGVGAEVKVKASSSSKFGLRYGEGHEAEYNMNVRVKAIQGAQPKGIERLLALAEKIVESSERANDEAAKLNA